MGLIVYSGSIFKTSHSGHLTTDNWVSRFGSVMVKDIDAINNHAEIGLAIYRTCKEDPTQSGCHP